MRPDPDLQQHLDRWSAIYHDTNYERGMAAQFLRRSHAWGEAAYGSDAHFSRVLEVGAGSGIHLDHVRHSFDLYVVTDQSPLMLSQSGSRMQRRPHGHVVFSLQDATHLAFPDASFDRLIAAHVLEHICHPHLVLREWARVLKPGGILSLVLPCDPGVAWRFGRWLSARRKFTRAGIEYDYWMAREHVNSINNLVALLRYYFPHMTQAWYPARLPSMDLNLFYVAHVRV